MKYSFYALRKTPRNERLPEDVNKPVEDYAKRLGGDDLLAQIVCMREKRLYGDVLHIEPQKKVVDGQFTFQDGMCTRFKLNQYFGEKIIVQRSIHNANLSMGKQKDSDESENPKED